MKKIAVLLFLLVSSGAMAGNVVRSYHLDRSGTGSSDLCDTTIGCPTLGIWFDDAVGATYTTEIGSYVMTVNGNPTRVAAGTWPAGFSGAPGYAWRMDGTGDYLSLADDPAFESQDFSVFLCLVPRAGFTMNDALLAKWNSVGASREWMVYSTNGTSIALAVSDDGSSGGGHSSAVTKASVLSINRLTCATLAYDYVADGSSVGNVWADEATVATSAVLDGPPFAGTATLTAGSAHGGSGDSPAEMYVVAYYPGVLTAADHLRLARRFRGLYDGSGSQVVTINTSATPPALALAPPGSGVTPFLVDTPANTAIITSPVSNLGGLPWVEPVTNLVQRRSFETWAAGAATGWTEVPTDTGDATQNTTTFAHGSSSMQLNNADADDAITVTGACLTVTGGADYNLSWFDRLISGTGSLDVAIYEDDSADCATPTGHTTIGVVPILNTWTKRATPYTMQAGTIRAQVWITLPAAAAQVTVVDAFQLKAGAVAVNEFCGGDTDASSVCTQILPEIVNPLNVSSWSVDGTWATPYSATDISGVGWYLFYSRATALTNNLPNIQLDSTLNVVRATVHAGVDGAGNYCYNYGDAFAANTAHQIRMGHSNEGVDGDITMREDGTWYANFTCSGVGTGRAIMNGVNSEFYIGGTYAAALGSGVVSGLTFYRSMMR